MGWILSAFADEADEALDGQIAVLKEAGLDHIDLRGVDGTSVVDLPADGAEAAQRKLADAGISVCMFGSPIGKLDIADDFETDLRRLRHLGELSRIFGTHAVRTFSYYNREERDVKTWESVAVDRLSRLTEEAERLGLVLYNENERHLFGDRLDGVGVLRDRVHKASPERFKLVFDFDNYNQSGDDVWANWLELREATHAFHLKESKKQPDGNFQHVPVDRGDSRIPSVLADAAERGWDGPLSLEPHLKHSRAVQVTGHSGTMSEAYARLSAEECFQIAARTARQVLADLGRLG